MFPIARRESLEEFKIGMNNQDSEDSDGEERKVPPHSNGNIVVNMIHPLDEIENLIEPLVRPSRK